MARGPRGTDWGSKVPPTVREDQVGDHLRNLNTQQCVGPGETHPRVPREPADAVAKPLAMIFEKSWQSSDVPGAWKKRNIAPDFSRGGKEGGGNYHPVSLTPLPGKIVDRILPEAVPRHREGIWDSQGPVLSGHPGGQL